MNEDDLEINIVLDTTVRIQVDDVGTDFRASIYDPEDLELLGEGWGETPVKAITAAFELYQMEEEQ